MLTATTTLADSWHAGHAWWPILWLVWLLALGVAILLFARGRRSHGARAILAERYARGEISADEYRERLANLR